MNFKKAKEMMKRGVAMKLPEWGGYWTWNSIRETIFIHTQEGKVIDIRSMEDVEATINNILSDKWIVATKENCTIKIA